VGADRLPLAVGDSEGTPTTGCQEELENMAKELRALRNDVLALRQEVERLQRG